MNKKLISIMLLPILSAFAANNIDLEKIAKERAEWRKQYLAKKGSPLLDGGVVVMSEKKMSQYKVFKLQRAKERRDVSKYGYIKVLSPETLNLLNFKKKSKNNFALKSALPSRSELRHNINDIEMAYKFKGVPTNVMSEMLGVAPSVTYIKDKGWAGAIQFFESVSSGTCSYRENNLKFSHGSIIVAEEDASYDVNNKVTVKTISGERNNGFMYNVDWYDENFFHELSCATKNYSEDILMSVINVARQIDTNN